MIELNAQQRQTFRDRGVLRIEGLLDREVLNVAMTELWARLAAQGLSAETGWLGASGKRTGAIVAVPKALKNLQKQPQFAALLGQNVVDIVDELLEGRAHATMVDYVQLLFTLPNVHEWRLPHKIWHLDMPRNQEASIPGVQIFACLNKVEPGGGGTVVVAGSHRLLNHGEFIRSRDVKKLLMREQWFSDLMSDCVEDRSVFMTDAGVVDGVEVQVIEMCGEPGDVYFVDMRSLHNLAPNARDVPRVMLTQRFLRIDCSSNPEAG